LKIKIPFISREKILEKRKERRMFKHKENVDNSLKILEKTIEVLNMHEVDYYLDFGTLLGAVREKGLISWDTDIDISLVNESDYIKVYDIIQDLEEEKFIGLYVSFFRSIKKRKDKLKKEPTLKVCVDLNEIDFTNPYNPRIANVRNKRKFRKKRSGRNSLDIFFKYEKDGYLYWMAENRVQKVSNKVLKKGLMEIDFYHLRVKIPVNHKEYLTEVYGNWQEPNKNWDESECITQIKKQHGKQ